MTETELLKHAEQIVAEEHHEYLHHQQIEDKHRHRLFLVQFAISGGAALTFMGLIAGLIFGIIALVGLVVG